MSEVLNYRRFTPEDHKVIIGEWKGEFDENVEDTGDEDLHSECLHGEWHQFNIPTGVMYYQVSYTGNILLTHSHFLGHGIRHQELHSPDRVKLVGGSPPF